jgi:hypothetical protein
VIAVIEMGDSRLLHLENRRRPSTGDSPLAACADCASSHRAGQRRCVISCHRGWLPARPTKASDVRRAL